MPNWTTTTQPQPLSLSLSVGSGCSCCQRAGCKREKNPAMHEPVSFESTIDRSTYGGLVVPWNTSNGTPIGCTPAKLIVEREQSAAPVGYSCTEPGSALFINLKCCTLMRGRLSFIDLLTLSANSSFSATSNLGPYRSQFFRPFTHLSFSLGSTFFFLFPVMTGISGRKKATGNNHRS